MDKELNIWKKEFRGSKEWKEKRQKLIVERGKKCEWGTSKEFLTPAHKNYFCKMVAKIKDNEFEFYFIVNNSILETNYYSIFNAYLKQVLIKELPNDYFKRKKDGTKYKDGKLRKEVWRWLIENGEMKKLFYPILEKVNDYFKKWYMDFDNCLLLCRRCHFAQSKGQLLCKCNKRYYFIQHSSCPDCYSEEKKKEIAKRKEDREKEEMEAERDYQEIVKMEREMFRKMEEINLNNKNKGK